MALEPAFKKWLHCSKPPFMKTGIRGSLVWITLLATLLQGGMAAAGELTLTIYNQNFAVVRDKVALELRKGTNQVRFAEATAFVEPSSVILRDPSGKHQFQVLEQNYRGDPISQDMMLALNEGKTVDFEIINSDAGQTRRELIPGRIVRSGGSAMRPIIEVNRKLRFGLPGQPIFPGLADQSIVKPTLQWVIESDGAARFDAEVSYITGEMRWEADYNLVLPERGNTLDIVGWVTMDNESGKSFENARIKLMAGDVNKIQNVSRLRAYARGGSGGGRSGPSCH